MVCSRDSVCLEGREPGLDGGRIVEQHDGHVQPSSRHSNTSTMPRPQPLSNEINLRERAMYAWWGTGALANGGPVNVVVWIWPRRSPMQGPW
jgi:hypothetical protein